MRRISFHFDSSYHRKSQMIRMLGIGLCIISLSFFVVNVHAQPVAWTTPTIITATPFTLGFSTFIGGQLGNYGYSIAVDSAGNSYITGYTSSSNFPMKNAYNSTFGGGDDAFVDKFNSTCELVFSTYLGGSGNYFAQGIAVDSAGNSYITGITSSSNFPMKNAYNSTFGGINDSFVSKYD